jgi:DNA processing protein
MPDLESWIALSMVPEVGPVTFKKLLSCYGDPSSVFRAPLAELSAAEGVGRKKAGNIKNFSGWGEVDKQVKQLGRCKARAVTFQDTEYPPLLRQEDDAPVLLFVRGSLVEEDRFAIAVVGSRRSSPYGRVVTEKITAELTRSGFTVVSGMARGIDTIAHTNSLTSGGRTIAVLGSGIDRAYPPENRGLMERITASGCVMSEFPCGARPDKENFPKRNRLISGLSMGVLVVEAAAGSGALITARCALEQNREVFAVPGNITSPNSAGTNELIKKGAKLIQNADDIIEELAPVLKGYVKAGKTLNVDISEEEKKVCDILSGEPVHIDALSRELFLSSASTLALLLGLEIKGIVKQTDGKRFYLVR